MVLNCLWKRISLFCFALCMMSFIAGCSGKSETPAGGSLSSDQLAPVTTMVEGYGDIELPIDMILETDKSMAMRTDSFQGGIHMYTGRVQIGSLRDYISFYAQSQVEDGWRSIL